MWYSDAKSQPFSFSITIMKQERIDWMSSNNRPSAIDLHIYDSTTTGLKIVLITDVEIKGRTMFSLDVETVMPLVLECLGVKLEQVMLIEYQTKMFGDELREYFQWLTFEDGSFESPKWANVQRDYIQNLLPGQRLDHPLAVSL